MARLRGEEGLKVDIFALEDPAGQAATDDDLEAVVLTKEVEKGGHIINQKRSENGKNELQFVFVDMILVSDDQDPKFSNKMSTTLIRNHLS